MCVVMVLEHAFRCAALYVCFEIGFGCMYNIVLDEVLTVCDFMPNELNVVEILYKEPKRMFTYKN